MANSISISILKSSILSGSNSLKTLFKPKSVELAIIMEILATNTIDRELKVETTTEIIKVDRIDKVVEIFKFKGKIDQKAIITTFE